MAISSATATRDHLGAVEPVCIAAVGAGTETRPYKSASILLTVAFLQTDPCPGTDERRHDADDDERDQNRSSQV
jgi:hypothetical protein